MTEQNETPDTADDAEGHHYMRDDAHRDDALHRTGDDVEGHLKRRGDDDSNDVEGHARHL